MTKIYESETFNDGKNVFIIFYKGEITGSMAVITKEIGVRGEAFITDIYVQKQNTEIFLKILIERVTDYCNICSARNIKLGIRQSEIHLISHINKLEFEHIYDAVIMKYALDKSRVLEWNKDMELKPLCISNSQVYMNIHNKAFIDSPNGATIDEVEVKDYIVQFADNEDLIGLCVAENKPCGIYELSTNGNIGWIDILAVEPKFQNKGIGQTLLVKCIKKLWEKNVNTIKLLVITSNEVAVKLYTDNGFKQEKVFSYWFEKKYK
jgi:ribosomal protein S18 acetylase RimI-like enzyme